MRSAAAASHIAALEAVAVAIQKNKSPRLQKRGLMKGHRQDCNADVVNSPAEKQPQATERTVQPGLTELLHEAKLIRIVDDHGDLPSGLIETPI